MSQLEKYNIVRPHPYEHFFLEFKHSIDLVFDNYKGDNYIEFVDIVNSISKQSDRKKIIYNTEQLTRENMKNHLAEISKKNIIFDYSSVNIDIIKNENDISKTLLLPILFNKETMCFDKNTHKDFDVIFLGEVTPRRHQIIKSLVEKGLSVFVMTCCYDFNLKHQTIMRARVLINLHAYNDYNVFEFARCSIPIFNDCIVISEPALNEKGSFMNDYVLSKVIFEKYDNFVDKVVEVVNNYNSYKYSTEYSMLEELTEKEIKKIKNEIEYIL